MSLTQKAYQALESVVGEESISNDPVICEAAIGGANGINVWDRGVIRPACVVLPKNTREVQEVVLIANRYKLPYIPTSASMSVFVSARLPNTIMVDLKRMNRLEIDDKNMFAICEPGVCGAELFAEIAKRGLWYVVPACGGQASVLANTAIHGMAPSMYRFGFPYRRILATEWVLPDGELLTLGSASLLDDYFWGEGPGPDLRGILRGTLGPLGGMGVVTKMAVKLLPFQPEPIEPMGVSPRTMLALPASRMKWFNIFFPTIETAVDAMYEIGKSEVGSMLMIIPTLFVHVARARGRGAASFWEEWNKVGDNVDWTNTFVRVLVIGSTSEKQLIYEEQVLKDIAAEFGGKIKEGRPTDESQLMSSDAICSFFVSGTFHCTELTFDSLDAGLKVARRSAANRKKYKGLLAEDHGYPGWMYSVETGHMCYYEFLSYGDVEDKESLAKLELDCMRSDIEGGAFPMYQDPSVLGPAWLNYHEILKRLKELFDPNNVSNPPHPERLPWNALPESMTGKTAGNN
jgi:FAD/FMN-containing dehydrogenase